jgi:hypothetical protein
MLDGFESLKSGLKKTLLPSAFLLTLEYLGCLFLAPDPSVRLGVVFGFVVGHVNIWSMSLLLGKMMSAKQTKNVLLLGGLLLLKVLILFALVAAGGWLFQWSLFGIAMGYVSVLFLVVLSVGLRYGSAAQNIKV